MLILGSKDGLIEIFTLCGENKGKITHTIKCDKEPLTRVFYHKDVGLLATSFKGLL